MTAPRRGLSLVEVLVIIAIIAILLGLFLPNVRNVRGAAARAACANNMKQILLGLLDYEVSHKRLPPGCLGSPGADPADRLAWTVAILPYLDLPYLEKESVAKKIDPDAGYAGNAATTQPIKLYRCPSAKDDSQLPLTHYFGCGGVGADTPSLPKDRPGIGLLGYDRQLRFLDVTDGTSNTIGLFETHDQVGSWAQGGFATLRGVEPTTAQTGTHEGKVLNVGMADGSVRVIREKTPFAKLAAAATVACGEPFDLD